MDLGKRSGTTVARYIRIVLSYLNVDVSFLEVVPRGRAQHLLRSIFYDSVSCNVVCYGQAISELCDVRDNQDTCNVDSEEVRISIDYLCLFSLEP